MPQFEDIHLFIPQVFWFAICFAVLYFFMSNIILPRIRDILEERQTTIDSNLTSTKNIEDEIAKINAKTDSIKKEATSQYQAKLEKASQEAALKRDKLNEEAKNKIEALSKKSQDDLKKFVDSTKDQSQKAIAALVKNIRLKLFNIS